MSRASRFPHRRASMGGVGSTLAAAELARKDQTDVGGSSAISEGWVELPSSSGAAAAAGTLWDGGEGLIGMGHVAAFLKLVTVLAGVALLTVPASMQPSLQGALQVLLMLLLLW